MTIVPTQYLPPSPQTLEDVCQWIRQFNANGPPLDPGGPDVGDNPSVSWHPTLKYLEASGAGSSGGLTGNASSYDWTVGTITGVTITGITPQATGTDRNLDTNLFKAGVGDPNTVSANTVPAAYSQVWAENLAYVSLETHFCLQQLIKDLISRGVIS